MNTDAIRDAAAEMDEAGYQPAQYLVVTLRETFGADQVDPSIKAGMGGVPGKFFARENGREIGTRFEEGDVDR